jgi:hypothetical protein
MVWSLSAYSAILQWGLIFLVFKFSTQYDIQLSCYLMKTYHLALLLHLANKTGTFLNI